MLIFGVGLGFCAGELDIHDAMITSLVEVLERKGILKQEEWEQNIKKQVALK